MESVQKGHLNGIPSIGIQIHKPGQTKMEDTQVDLVSGKTIDLDMMRYYPEINAEETAIQKIRELVENLHDVNVVGNIPENMSAELMIRGVDPKGEIYNEELQERTITETCKTNLIIRFYSYIEGSIIEIDVGGLCDLIIRIGG